MNILNKIKDILSKKEFQLGAAATIFTIVGFIIGKEYEKRKQEK